MITAKNLLGENDLTKLDLDALRTLADLAKILGGICDAVCCQPRCVESEGAQGGVELNAVGELTSALAAAFFDLAISARREARQRPTAKRWGDRETQFELAISDVDGPKEALEIARRFVDANDAERATR